MARRPIIGITGPDRGGYPAWFFASLQVRLQGGRPRRITPARNRRTDDLNGLILGGGADLDPARYEEDLLRTIRRESRADGPGRFWHFVMFVATWLIRRTFSMPSGDHVGDLARDELEFEVLETTLAMNRPVLGICRGGQLINVHFGGTLHQDISGFYNEHPNLRTVRARKLVNLNVGTKLARITGRKSLLVNSLHRQSVKTLGRGLYVSAVEPNGVIQAVEHPSLPFVIGVQWHPEFLIFHREQRFIFRELVRTARSGARTREVCPLPG